MGAAPIRRSDDDASAVQAPLSGQVDAIGAATPGRRRDREDRTQGRLRHHDHAARAGARHRAPAGAGRPDEGRDAFVAQQAASGALNATFRTRLNTGLPELRKPAI